MVSFTGVNFSGKMMKPINEIDQPAIFSQLCEYLGTDAEFYERSVDIFDDFTYNEVLTALNNFDKEVKENV